MSAPGRDVPPGHEDAADFAVHPQAVREAQEPGESAEAGPWWFWAFAVLALVFGAFYFGRYSGAFRGAEAVHTGVDGPAVPAGGAAAPAAGAPAAGAVNGASVYASRCAACHQANGAGLPGAFPPLAGSEYVLGEPERVVRVVLHGLIGSVTVKGQAFNGAMPAWADQLSDAEIAAVLTYERSSFGNSAPAITADLVADLRAATASRTTPWTAAELR